jgi:hypothetical protein
MEAGTDRNTLPGRVPEFGSSEMHGKWIYHDLPGGDFKFLAPSATHRSWVTVRGAADAIELTASFERAPGEPMGDFQLNLVGSDHPFALFHSTRLARSPP